jgi:sodium transport system permease protein
VVIASSTGGPPAIQSILQTIPDDYPAHFRAGRPATVELIVDQSRTEALGSIRRVRELIEAYAASVGMLRLLARGVDPQLAQPVNVLEVDLSTEKKRAAIFLNLIPMFVLLASFIGGMYTATDSTAGERERGSLEPLLITPIARRSLVLGKWLATVLFSSTTVILTFAFTVVALSQVPLARFGVSLSLGAIEVVGVLLAILPLPLCVAGVQLLIASFTRSFKEAQTYMSLMIFIPMLPALWLMLDPAKAKLWMAPIPVFGQQVLLGEVLRGEAVPFASYALAAISATACGLICVHLTALLFRRERIIYGR